MAKQKERELTVNEYAKEKGITTQAVYGQIKSGKLKVHKFKHLTLIIC